MVEGKEITLGTDKYILPPIPLAGLSKLGDRLSLIGAGFTLEAVDAMIDGVWLSLLRNYPDIPRDVVEMNIDLLNQEGIFQAWVSVNRLDKRKEPVTGEIPAGEQTGTK